MKIQGQDGRSYEVLVDGRPAEGVDVFHSFMAIASALGYPHAVMAQRADGSARGVAFAADEKFANRLQALMQVEPLWGMENGTKQ